jgi:hypothetical protein
MPLEAIPQFPRLRLFIFRLADKTAASLIHLVEHGTINRKDPRFLVQQHNRRSVDRCFLGSPSES